MACADLLVELRNIVAKLGEVKAAVIELHDHFMRPHRLPTFFEISNGWNVVRSGTAVIYSKEVTLTGVTQVESLPLNRTLLLFQHVYISFSTTNAKTCNFRTYNASTPTLYTELDNFIGLTDPSRIVQLGVEHKTRSHKLEWNFSTYTAGEVVNIEVTVEEV